MTYSPYATPLFLVTGMTALLAGYALRKREQKGAITFCLLMIALSLWSLFYALSISSADLETAYLFNRLKYIGVMSVPPLWLILALQYTGRESLLTRRNVALIFLPAALLLPVALTNPLTGLWWVGVQMESFNEYPVLTSQQHGLLYYVHTALSYTYIVVGLILYIVHLFAHRAERIYRSQAILMVIAAAIPLVANILTQMKEVTGIAISPLPWALDSFFFALSTPLIAIAIFRYRFLDIVPVARQAVFEQIPVGVIVIDPAVRIVGVNPAARAMMGNTEMDSVIGQPLDQAISIPELRQALLEVTHQDNAQPQKRDVHVRQERGERFLSLKTTPLSERQATPIGQIILLQDISERIAAQRKLEGLYRQAELERERLFLTISSASDAILLIDHDGRLLASNPTAWSILRTNESEAFPAPLKSLINIAQTSGKIAKAEIEIAGQSFHAVVTPIGRTGLVLTMHDVTHFKRLAHMKDEFVATVSHDLRSPLNSILGFAEIAQMEDTPESERQESLDRIVASVYRMSGLISNLLDLAKLEAGVEYQSLPVALDKLAHEAIEDLEGAALAKGLYIQRELVPHPSLTADPQLISQVWRNLIDNAIKYTKEGTVTVRVMPETGQVIGQVTDTGMGIPPADMPYVFDKFFRAQQAELEEIIGTGLGLSLVKSIVEKYGGQIWVESQLDAGTTFTFTFPLPTGVSDEAA